MPLQQLLPSISNSASAEGVSWAALDACTYTCLLGTQGVNRSRPHGPNSVFAPLENR